MDVSIAEEKDPAERRRVIANLTARLPEWFGRPESNRHYAEQSEMLETARRGRFIEKPAL